MATCWLIDQTETICLLIPADNGKDHDKCYIPYMKIVIFTVCLVYYQRKLSAWFAVDYTINLEQAFLF